MIVPSSHQQKTFVPEIFVGKILVAVYDIVKRFQPGIYCDYEGAIKRLGDCVIAHVPGPNDMLICADQTTMVRRLMDDVLEVQSDWALMDYHCRKIAEQFMNNLYLIPPLFFAVQVIEISRVRASDALAEYIDAEFAYGIRPLDSFRLAAAIAIQGRRQGLDDEEILSTIRYEKNSQRSRIRKLGEGSQS